MAKLLGSGHVDNTDGALNIMFKGIHIFADGYYAIVPLDVNQPHSKRSLSCWMQFCQNIEAGRITNGSVNWVVISSDNDLLPVRR